MEELISKISNSYCPVCKKDYLVELYESNGSPVGFIDMCKNNKLTILLNLLDSIELSHFACTKCGTRFAIDWRRGQIPIPYIKYKGEI